MNRYAACLTICLALWCACFAGDPPDSEINPQTGLIETVTTVWNGSNHDVALTIDRDELPPISGEIVTGPAEDIDPRIAIDASGAATVVWTRDGSVGEIRARRRTSAGWGSEQLVSDASEDSRNPEIVVDGSVARVVYEIDDSTAKSVAVGVIGDEPDPFGQRTIVATDAWTEDLDARIHARAGHVWITWVHDSSLVGWSELKGDGSWSAADYRGYSTGDTDSTYGVIRDVVLGL